MEVFSSAAIDLMYILEKDKTKITALIVREYLHLLTSIKYKLLD